VSSDIQVFIDHHQGPDPSNPDQLCSQSATDALVSCHHFSMLCAVVLSLTCISVVFARKIWRRNGDTPWRGGQLERAKTRPDGLVH
jgi:hypothetical protein